MAGEDTVVSVTTSSGSYSEHRIDGFCESTSAVLSHSQPHQPCSFAFRKRSFGKKTIVWRAFQAKRFDSYSWLHYDEANDVAFCYLCKQATAEKKRHKQSKPHKEATHAIFTLPSC